MTCNDSKNALKVNAVSSLEQKRAIIEACDHAFSNPVAKRDQYETLLHKIHTHGEFLAVRGQDLVGYLAMYANDCVTGIAYVTLVAVKPECQNMGAGAALLEAGIDLARSRSMKAVKLEVKKANTGAVRLYERLGFCTIGEASHDSVYMMKTLSDKK